MLDPYVYPGTSILRNVLDIQKQQMLDDAEADYVSLRLRELAEYPLEGEYDVDHLTEMHNISSRTFTNGLAKSAQST